MTDLLDTYDNQSQPYILLTPKKCISRASSMSRMEDIDGVISSFSKSRILAVDFETVGAEYATGHIRIAGMGLAWDSGVTYFDWNNMLESTQQRLLAAVASHPGTIAHNIYFDGGVLLTNLGRHAAWMCDTYSLLAMLANEGVPGRFWGLKQAQVELLLWETSNEYELDKWLCLNGYYTGVRRLAGNVDGGLAALWEEGRLKPDKSQMWRAPADILGHYCCMDAEACYLLFTEILEPVAAKFPALLDYVCGDFLKLTLLHVEQKLQGIPVDRDGLAARAKFLETEMERLAVEFLKHPDVAPHIPKVEKRLRKAVYAKEPLQFNKNGSESMIYLNWKDKIAKMEAGAFPVLNFNTQSHQQLSELLYDSMGFECRIFTESGDQGTGVKALKQLGEVGKILVERNYMAKEIGFMEKYLELANQFDGKIHPGIRTPGTTTGRMSSSEPNLQQIPKSNAVMGLFHARPGHTWVDLDIAALEPSVTAEFSQDDNMLFLYGSNSQPNDIYLFVGASIPSMRSRILATGYDPMNPTPEAIARAKKECKHERSICKVVVLSAAYGAGIKKIQSVLEEDGILVPYEDVAAIHRGYWETFAGVKDFGRSLLFEWKRNKGYILNGVGRPMAVPEEMSQDLLNRFIQSTGHDVFVKYICILTDMIDASGITWYPVILDFHDAITVEVEDCNAEAVAVMMQKALDELNRRLGGTVKLKGVPVIGRTLAAVKEPSK